MVQILFAVVAMVIAGTVGPMLLAIAGFPGARLAGKNPWNVKQWSPRWWAGLAFCAIGQSYVALVWAGFVALFSRNNQSEMGWFGWLLWAVCFFTAIAPASAATTQSVAAQRQDPLIHEQPQHAALVVSGTLGAAGFLVFAIWPRLFHLVTPWVGWKG